MTTADLLRHIDEIDKIGNDQWMSKLEPRKLAELEFHNRDRDKNFIAQAKAAGDSFEKFYGNKKYYTTTQRSRDYVAEWIRREAKGRVFLDYACGNGVHAMSAAESGAELALGLDISNVSVQNCIETASERGLSNARFFQADAERTMLPDNSVDRIICSGMLHHLDLSFAFPELRRILKPGGKLLAVEALDYNPAIKLYRMMTPDMRTEWEKAHILSLADITFAKRFFEIGEVRYWHVIGYAGAVMKPLARPLDMIDSMLERVPLFNRLAWTFTFELVKPQDTKN